MTIEPVETSLSAAELFDMPDDSESPWWPSEEMPGAEDGEWLEAEQMPKGKYFIGDPCYVLDDFQLEVPQGIAHDLDGIGRVFWVSVDNLSGSTDSGRTYYYDSMSVGIVPIDHLTPGQWAALKHRGRLIEWTNGDVLPDDECEDWEGATMVGIDFCGNVYLGNDWWFTYDFVNSSLLPESLYHLRSSDDEG